MPSRMWHPVVGGFGRLGAPRPFEHHPRLLQPSPWPAPGRFWGGAAISHEERQKGGRASEIR
eukprot:9497648-Pyramimonas_sp.AAC.1